MAGIRNALGLVWAGVVLAGVLAGCSSDDGAAGGPDDGDSVVDTDSGGDATSSAPDGQGSADTDSGDTDSGDTGSGDADAPEACPEGFEELGSGPWALGASEVQLASGEGEPMRLALGRVDSEFDALGLRWSTGVPAVKNDFGAFSIVLDGPLITDFPDVEPSTLQWFEAGAPARVCSDGASELLLIWAAPEGLADGDVRLRLTEQSDRLRLAVESDASNLTGAELSVGCASHFFGLGSQAFAMDLRGHRIPLWTQEQGIGKPEDGGLFPINNVPEAAYAPMGVLHAYEGWSAVLGIDAFTEADLCFLDPERAALRSHGDRLALEIFEGEPAERVSATSARLGRLETRPPLWAYGPWNDSVGGPGRLAEVTETLRAEGIPASAVWSEDWAGGGDTIFGFELPYSWAWDPETYPELAASIDALHEQGFAFLGYFNPFIVDPTPMWQEALDGGYFLKLDSGEPFEFIDPFFRPTMLVDLTAPDAREWMATYLTMAAARLGIDGWMADYAEWVPVNALGADGTPGWQLHNRYPIEWQSLNREVMESVHGAAEREEWTFFARSGWASTERATSAVAPVMWAGDQETGWTLDDGYPTVIPILAHLGLSGVPLTGSDIGGFSSIGDGPTPKELYFRWVSLGALHPVMRTHHGSFQCRNWAFDRDADTLAHYGRWAKVHNRLTPMWEAWLDEALETGQPIVRHPWLVEPDQTALFAHSGDELPRYGHFVGAALWVNPVIEEGAEARDVLIPEGDSGPWYDLFGGAAFPAGATLEFEVPVTELVALVRPGTVLRLFVEATDTLFPGAGPEIRGPEAEAGRAALALYPRADGTVGPASLGGISVDGVGWDAPDWSSAAVDGRPLAACNESPEAPCVDAAAGVAWVEGGAFALEAGDARLIVDSAESITLQIGLAAPIWGELAEPTAVGELEPDLPFPCER